MRDLSGLATNGEWLTRSVHHSVLIFILTLLLLSADFYYLKNIAGRRLVGLRWWNEVDTATGDSKWVFESAPEGRGEQNRTDNRFFWIALYAQPAWWVLLAVWSVITLKVTWLSIIGRTTLRLLQSAELLQRPSYLVELIAV